MKNFILKNRKTIILIPIIIIIFLVLLSLVIADIHRKLVIKSREENLQVLAEEKAEQVDIFLESQKNILLILSKTGVFKEVLLYPNSSVSIINAQKRIEELSDIIPWITILNNDGVVIAGNTNITGTDFSKNPYFVKKYNNTIMFGRYYDPIRGKDYYAIVGPVYDRVDKNKIIGTIGFDLELEKISSLMKEIVENKNGEVYLIDYAKLLLSNSSYLYKDNRNGILIQEIESEGANECLFNLNKYERGKILKNDNKRVLEYVNYMGDKVIGAYAYVPSIMGCVIAEDNFDGITKFSFLDYIKNIFGNK